MIFFFIDGTLTFLGFGGLFDFYFSMLSYLFFYLSTGCRGGEIFFTVGLGLGGTMNFFGGVFGLGSRTFTTFTFGFYSFMKSALDIL